jgi:hypothetical protein
LFLFLFVFVFVCLICLAIQIDVISELFICSNASPNESVDLLKLPLAPRTMCLFCGRHFASRGKLFEHLKSTPSHDIPPEQAVHVVRKCLSGELERASMTLWNTPLRIFDAFYTVLQLLLGKKCEFQQRTEGMSSQILELFQTLSVMLRENVQHHFIDDEEQFQTLSQLVDLIQTSHQVSQGEFSIKCEFCRDTFLCPRTHCVPLKECSHFVCQQLLVTARDTGDCDTDVLVS